eukprot:9669068-Alexandrium_andersonii.AAC.1
MPGESQAKPKPPGSGRPPQSRTRLRKVLKALPAAPCLGTRQGQPTLHAGGTRLAQPRNTGQPATLGDHSEGARK